MEDVISEISVYNLVLAGGGEVYVEFDANIPRLWEHFRNALITGGLFNEPGYDSVKIKFCEKELEVLNCADVIGWN